MKTGEKLARFYIRHINCFAAAYVLLPLAAWVCWILMTAEFREVYYLRIAISLIVGLPLSMFFNKYGVNLWLAKHSSTRGPAGGLDGAIIGSFIGAWITMVPVLTSLIATNDLEQAKTFVIASWLLAVLVGGLVGGFLGAFGRWALPRR